MNASMAYASLRNAIINGNRQALAHFVRNDALLRLVVYMVMRSGMTVRNPAATLDWLIDTYGIRIDVVHPLPMPGAQIRPLIIEAIRAPRSMELLPVILAKNPVLENALSAAISAHNHNAVRMLIRHTGGSLAPFGIGAQDIMNHACQTCYSCVAILWRVGVDGGEDMDPQVLFSHLIESGAWARVFYLFKARSLLDIRYLMENTPLVEGAKTRRTANVGRKKAAPTWLKNRLERCASLPSVEVAPTRSELCNIVRETLGMDLALFQELGEFFL